MFLGAFAGDLGTYVVTSVQLALAFPDAVSGFGGAFAKFAGIFKLDMQDIGAQQTGMTKDEFKAMLVAAGK